MAALAGVFLTSFEGSGAMRKAKARLDQHEDRSV